MPAAGASNAPAPTGATYPISSGASVSDVQTAVSAAVAGTTLVFPPDTALSLTSETALKTGVSLYGLPGAQLIAAQSAGQNCFHANGVSDVNISGFICDGGAAGGGGTSINAFVFVENGSNNVRVEWNDFRNNFNQSDLYMFNSDNTYFRKNRCLNNEYQPVSCHHTDGAHDHVGLWITDNSVQEYKRMAFECLINIQGGYHFDRNTVAGQDVPWATGGGIAVSLVNDYGDNGPGTPNQFGTIIGNNFSGSGVGLEINLENMTISDNVIDIGNAVSIAACPGSVIENNTITSAQPFSEDGGYNGTEWIGTNIINGVAVTGWAGHGPYGAKPTLYLPSDEPGGIVVVVPPPGGEYAAFSEKDEAALLGDGGPFLLEKSIVIVPPHEGGYELGYRPFAMKTSQQKAEPQRRRPNKEMGPIAYMLRDS